MGCNPTGLRCDRDTHSLADFRETLLHRFASGFSSIQNTTDATDLAIAGPGFFVLRNPADNSYYATRSGHIQRAGAGHLVATKAGVCKAWPSENIQHQIRRWQLLVCALSSGRGTIICLVEISARCFTRPIRARSKTGGHGLVMLAPLIRELHRRHGSRPSRKFRPVLVDPVCFPQPVPPMAHAQKSISEIFQPSRPNIRYFILNFLI